MEYIPWTGKKDDMRKKNHDEIDMSNAKLYGACLPRLY